MSQIRECLLSPCLLILIFDVVTATADDRNSIVGLVLIVGKIL